MSGDLGLWRPRRDFDPRWVPHPVRYVQPPGPLASNHIYRSFTTPIPHGAVDYDGYPTTTASRPSSSGRDYRNVLASPRRSSLPLSPPTRLGPASRPPTPPPQEVLAGSWPPPGYGYDSILSPRDADDLICNGASTFKGYYDEIPNAPPGSRRFFAVMESEHYQRTDRAETNADAFRDISLTVTGPDDSAFPWMSLEQPCMTYCFGKYPGTTTLNYYVSGYGCTNPTVKVQGPVKPKKMKLISILDRLTKLELGLEEEDPEKLYSYLYGTLIHDPDKRSEPHKDMHTQIIDLITILSHVDWVDYSQLKNQVVAKFFDSMDPVRKHHFFHQLLLSSELYLRIHTQGHTDKSKRQLLMQLPPKIAWDLAVAQRWLENVGIKREQISSSQSTFSFELHSKKRQKEALLRFANVLKWPNIGEVQYILSETDTAEKPVEDRSADAMAWFTGVVLPGVTLPWLLMNSLIDCDRATGEALKYLTHMRPFSGFQYRAVTYWSHSCVVGRVLGALRGVNTIAGWIGPCNFSPDLKRTECVQVRQAPVPAELQRRLTTSDLDSMVRRTHPLGPSQEGYAVKNYDVLLPDFEDVSDGIRVEKLAFEPIRKQDVNRAKLGADAPLTFDATILFAIMGNSRPLKLKYDVDFIAAYPCYGGPHPLLRSYAYRAIKPDGDLLTLDKHPSAASWDLQPHDMPTLTLGHSPPHRRTHSDPYARTASQPVTSTAPVTVIEALGVSDNEVFARAWCASVGAHAVVANTHSTCLACAIREALAARVGVVIVTSGGKKAEGKGGVDG
ncbi:hypothetical protein P152DRAFT_432374 [Eremomyces bilateralis CBS 781.70]|uniref:Uncharacterized protein n=1 Tax=Eremomyces bilateralis CBS 781.70 TaxID=1392243 RepID=A0A6G1G8N8_9PEZI|nr:uncharacterized protein P152DRAFT_432374 [Eremomyces bilateralis CBS 781.70]KAF1814438.1 hypothetical protein P152DRAFT_432374 [Eremomyces bilateralis CBS 781.70]